MKTRRITELINQYKNKTSELIITEKDIDYIGEYLVYNKILLCNKGFKFHFEQLIIDVKLTNIKVPDSEMYSLEFYKTGEFNIILKLKRKEKIVMINNRPVKIYY